MFEKEQKIINELSDRTIQSKSNTDVLFKPKTTEPSSPINIPLTAKNVKI